MEASVALVTDSYRPISLGERVGWADEFSKIWAKLGLLEI
jgi:hypothetical protein